MTTQQIIQGRCIGIDLGTTNSVIAYINDSGQAEVIPSCEGGNTIPSVFAITDDGEKLVGKPAIDQESLNPANTIRSIKRHMGTKKRFTIQGQKLSPEEISSEILKKLKTDAEAFFGESITSAVITVPAYFNDSQRTATKVAGKLAGLDVLRIINEPTAAALAYGLNNKNDETILVYDLGGGTFDVTILKITDNGSFFEVQSTSGDTHLGGDDFDNEIVRLIEGPLQYDYFVTKPGYVYTMEFKNKTELPFDETHISRLRDAAEQAKKQLSASKKTVINIPYFANINGEPIHIKTTITREDFENAIKHLIIKTKVCVETALTDAGIKYSDLNEVVFVGGSTRVPAIIQAIEKWTGKKPNLSVNPDEAVALGAAIQAGIITGTSEKKPMLLDVAPLSLGVETLGGVMTTMIPRNTTIPVDYSEIFTTAEDNQKQVDVRVFQGERPRTVDNILLGEFHMLGIPIAPRNVPKIEVTFSVDHNGILSVTAIDKINDVEKQVTITGASSLSSEDIARIIDEANKHKEDDDAYKELVGAQALVRDKLVQVESLLRDSINVLSRSVIKDLFDLAESLEQGQTNPNLELLSSLTQVATESIKVASDLVYEAAKKSVEEGVL